MRRTVGLIAAVAALHVGACSQQESPEISQRPPLPSPSTLIATRPAPSAICHDGTVSNSQSRQGTCSWHGGVRSWAGGGVYSIDCVNDVVPQNWEPACDLKWMQWKSEHRWDGEKWAYDPWDFSPP